MESEECWEFDRSIHRDMCASLGMNRMQRRTTYISIGKVSGVICMGEVVVGKEIKKFNQWFRYFRYSFFSTKARIIYDKKRKDIKKIN